MSWTLHTLSDFPDRLRGSYVVVGNFDGVHRGHREILQRASRLATMDERFLLAVTFDPHARAGLSTKEPFLQLTGHDEKCRLLKEAGADDVISLEFDAETAALSAAEFIDQVLVKYCDAKAIVVGQDFRFGADREGTTLDLVHSAPNAGLAVHVVPPVLSHDTDEIISSQLIRSRLAVGDLKSANQLLGRRWTVDGLVVHGDKRGRQLGFPTANLGPTHDVHFGFGIYAVRVLLNGIIRDGVACYGTRPQFDDGAPRIEVHILDFAGDIYGERLVVEFVAFQRSERTFSGVEALKQQIDQDCLMARRLLSSDFEDPEIDSVLERRAGAISSVPTCIRGRPRLTV